MAITGQSKFCPVIPLQILINEFVKSNLDPALDELDKVQTKSQHSFKVINILIG